MLSFRAQDGSVWTKTDQMAAIFVKRFAAAPSAEGSRSVATRGYARYKNLALVAKRLGIFG